MKGQLLKRQSLTFCEKGASINHPGRRARAFLTNSSEPCSGPFQGRIGTSLCRNRDYLNTCWDNLRNLSLQSEDVCLIQEILWTLLYTLRKESTCSFPRHVTTEASPGRTWLWVRHVALPAGKAAVYFHAGQWTSKQVILRYWEAVCSLFCALH